MNTDTSTRPQAAVKVKYHRTEQREPFEFSWNVWLGMVVTWVCLYFTNRKSVYSLQVVAYFTIPLTALFLFLLLLVGVTLGDGVSAGVSEYLNGTVEGGADLRTIWTEL